MQSLSQKWNIWDDQGSLDERLLKATLVEFSCRSYLKSCLDKATENFRSIPEDYFLFADNTSIINP